MGAGKSTVGRRLADALGLRFVDTDLVVCESFGTSIASLIEQHGEPFFRSLERAACLDALAEPDGGVVVSLGGGAVTIDDVARRLAEPDVFSVYISAEPSTSARRARADRSVVRPLLAGADPEQTLRRLLEERRARYEAADLRVCSDDRPVDDILANILAALPDA